MGIRTGIVARGPSACCRLILPISIIYEDTIGCMCSLVVLSLLFSLSSFASLSFFASPPLHAEVNDRAISQDAIHILLLVLRFLVVSPVSLVSPILFFRPGTPISNNNGMGQKGAKN